jgi:hypothetical protein
MVWWIVVLFCYHPHPVPELVRAISNLDRAQRIQQIWLTGDASIDRALQPEQRDLVAAIWAAINRFTET